MADIILASKSERRKQLLKMLNIDFEIMVSDVDETFSDSLTDTENVKRIALNKARAIARKNLSNKIVIACDTIVVCDGVLTKPKNEEDAYKMLRKISGREHKVISAVAIVCAGKEIVRESITDVLFKKLTDTEIENYINTGEAWGKAGAYAIQGYASIFVKRIKGCYYNVMGLPLNLLYEVLKSDFNFNINERYLTCQR